MSDARQEGSAGNDRQQRGGGAAVAVIAILFAGMAFVGIGASRLSDGTKTASVAEPPSTYGVVATARASRTSITPVHAQSGAKEFPLSVPVGTTYPAPSESATSGNPMDMTY